MSERGLFTGRVGFVLATAGAAVGLGNIWRFPTMATENGGGTFLLAYFILLLVFGLPMVCTEIAIGRKTRRSPPEAYASLDRRGRFIGVLSTVVPAIIFPYYCVVGGWILGFVASYVVGLNPSGSGFFAGFSGSWWAVAATVAFLTIVGVIVYFGVDKGIEKLSRVFMPVFLVLLVVLVIYIAFQPGMVDGFVYFLSPDISKLNAGVFMNALGQVFFSLSIAMGISITFGSYMKKEDSIQRSTSYVIIIDTVVAVLAGLLVVPMAFKAFGTDIPSGAGLAFVALPKIFEGMPGGYLVAIGFFVMLLIAAVTSAVAILEAVVSAVIDRFGLERRKAVLAVSIPSIIVGAVISMGFGPLEWMQLAGMGLLDFFDFVANNLLMPVVAFCMCVFVGHVISPRIIQDEIENPGGFVLGRVYPLLIKWILPLLVALILLFVFLP